MCDLISKGEFSVLRFQPGAIALFDQICCPMTEIDYNFGVWLRDWIRSGSAHQ